MGRIIPGKKYTPAQIRRLISEAEAHELQMTGYVLRHDVLDDTYTVVHWTNASSGQEWGEFRQDQRFAIDPNAFPAPPPIQKRTPMERVDSLMARFIQDCKRAGTVPGLDDARISTILGAAKNTQRDGITAEEIRKIAADFLAKAEKEKELADYKKIVRPSPNA